MTLALAATCSVEGCDWPVHRRGMCGAHGERVRTHGDPMPQLPVRRKARGSVVERFWAYVPVGEPDECWLWTGGTNSAGYPRIADEAGEYVLATRLSLELERGEPLPPGVHACHHCDTPLCVNPAHLFAGTRSDNMRDMVEKGRAGWQR